MEFIKYNANPKHRKTGDCFVRAICVAFDEDWIDTYKALIEIGLARHKMITDKKVTEEYIKSKVKTTLKNFTYFI